MAGQYADASSMLAQSLPMAEQLGDQRLLGQVLVNKNWYHYACMQHREAVEAGLRAAELLRSAGDLWYLTDALWTTEHALVVLGRLDEVAEIDGEVEPLAARVGHLAALVCAEWGRGWRAALTADLDRFEEISKEALDLGRSIGFPWFSQSYTHIGQAHFWRGRWEEALENFQEGARLEPPGFFAGARLGFPFLAKAYAGDGDEALAILREKMGELPRPGQTNTMGAWTMLLTVVEGLAVLRQLDEAAKLYSLVMEAIDTGALVRPFADGLLQTVAGIAAACGGKWDEAEEHYRTALRQAHEIPHKIEQPEVRRWYARMLLDRDGPGDRDKAFRRLTEAIAMYREIGMPKHIEMAEALLGEA